MIVPCIALLTVYFQNRILHWNRKVRKLNSQITSAYNEGITGVRTSKSMGIEPDNDQAFFVTTSQMHRAASRSARLNAVYIPVILLFSSVASAIVLVRGGGMVQKEIMQLGRTARKRRKNMVTLLRQRRRTGNGSRETWCLRMCRSGIRTARSMCWSILIFMYPQV